MPSVRYGVFAIALGLTIATGAAAEELATCGANPSHRMADLPRVAFRSFWPMEGYSRQFAEAGIKLVFVFPAKIWTGPNQYHWNSLDDHLDDVLKWNPRAKLMVMVDLNTPAWWVRSHGGEEDFLRQAEARPDAPNLPHRCKGCGSADSFCHLGEVALRDDFRHDLKEYLRRFLEHTEANYGEKIVAWHHRVVRLAKGQAGPAETRGLRPVDETARITGSRGSGDDHALSFLRSGEGRRQDCLLEISQSPDS
jgi:hypothetical protein